MPRRRYVDAGGEDDRARGDGRALGERRDEPVCVRAEPGHVLHEGEARAEDPRLLVRLPGEQRAADAAREAEVVADQRARPRLSPDPVRVDDERAEAPRRRRRPPADSPAGPAPTISRSISLSSGSTAEPVARVSSTSLGFTSVVPSGRITTGSSRLGLEPSEQLPSLVRVGEAERVGERAALEHRPQLGGPARPRVADDVDRVRRGAPLLGPLEQERRDRLVEELVRRRHRPDDVVVDLPVLDRLEDRVAGRAEAPVAPADEQRALRVRVELAHLAEQLAAGRLVELLAREHDRDRFARRLGAPRAGRAPPRPSPTQTTR